LRQVNLNCTKMQTKQKEIRLQKYLAHCGVGSRRACEQLIDQGVVIVDGKQVTQQGIKINPTSQIIQVQGRKIVPEPLVYILLNKPRDVLCTSKDCYNRRTVLDVLPKFGTRLYTVGRLDRNSEGLLIVTNDGQLAFRLTHPRFHIAKTYYVWPTGILSPNQMMNMRKGIFSENEKLKAKHIRRIQGTDKKICYEVVLDQGKNQQIRRMFASVGFEVQRLLRTQIGALSLSGLRCGQWRYLTRAERASFL
jgi:23S rRNA pseudouridine2605 synthase